jgi:hypothetical protein
MAMDLSLIIKPCGKAAGKSGDTLPETGKDVVTKPKWEFTHIHIMIILLLLSFFVEQPNYPV